MITIIFNGGYAILGLHWIAKRQCHLHTTSAKISTYKAWLLCRTTQNCGCELMLVRCYAQTHEWYQRDWQYCGNTNVNTNSMRTKTLKSIERTTYNKIPLSGLQRRARHALAHDALLQMGSYGTHGAVSSKKVHIRHWCGPLCTSFRVNRLQKASSVFGLCRIFADLGVQSAPEGCSANIIMV